MVQQLSPAPPGGDCLVTLTPNPCWRSNRRTWSGQDEMMLLCTSNTWDRWNLLSASTMDSLLYIVSHQADVHISFFDAKT